MSVSALYRTPSRVEFVRLLPFLLLAILMSSPALAQDSDGDGANDTADTYPCDAHVTGAMYAPSQSTWNTLAF